MIADWRAADPWIRGGRRVCLDGESRHNRVVDSYDAIQLIERDLRTLVRLVLGPEDAWLAASNRIERAKLDEKREDERRKRPAAALNEDLLEYTEFTQLQNLILDEAWPKFQPALGTRNHISTYLSKASGFRNPTMHSRALLPFEEHLVLGISGELRNRVALYRREIEGESMFWPVIEEVTDSFGNSAVGPSGDAGSATVRLEVGDTVTFDCRAYDPENRELTWRLHQNARGVDLDTAIGESVRLTWIVTAEDIAESVPIVPIIKSTGPYHRVSAHWGDDHVMFHYSVNPPRGAATPAV